MAFDPLFQVRWYPAILRVRTATVAEEPAAEGEAPKAPETEAKPAPEAKADEKPAADKQEKAKVAPDAEEPALVIRGLSVPRDGDKPLLVYFHWPHEDGDKGKRVVKFCGGPLDDEAFVRVTPLFRCIEVNTRDSEERLVDEAKVRVTPTLAVCRPDGSVVWRTEDTGLSGKALAETLKKQIRTRFPEDWKKVEAEVAAQKKSVAEARALLASGKTEEALIALNGIVDSDVRFTDEWAQAVTVLREEQKKAEDAKKKEEKR